MIGFAILISLWEYILIAIGIICALAIAAVFLYLYLNKQLKSNQEIVLSAEDVRDGVEANITVAYDSQMVTFRFGFPPNVRDGQKFVAKNILFESKKGRKVKKNVRFRVRVTDDGKPATESSQMKTAFDQQTVYELLRKIPQGRVVTYGEIARAMGNRSWARSVGNALHDNPDGERYPCYKVVNNKGDLSHAYAFGGIDEQKRRLEADGVMVHGYKVDLTVYGYTFETGAPESDRCK